MPRAPIRNQVPNLASNYVASFSRTAELSDRAPMAPARADSLLRFQRPAIPPQEAIEQYFALSRARGWFANGGPCSKLLERRLADRIGAYCVAVASGTSGLMAAVAALLEHTAPARREVLLPAFTFPATLQATTWAGLTPRFLDVNASHWHLDPEHLQQELRARRNQVALVIAVSSFGTPPPSAVRRAWEESCADAGVGLIVDSAAGFGAVGDDGIPIGRQGNAEVVSFHATKPFAIGEGGAVFTSSRRSREHLRSLINFGFDADRQVGLGAGFNGKMSELHAATALAVLDRFDSVLETRRRAALSVRRQIAALVSWQDQSLGSTWQFVPVAFSSASERDAVERCCEADVEVRRYYQPLHSMAPFLGWPTGRAGLGVTEDLYERLLCLPMANDLTLSEAHQIARAVSRGLRSGPPYSALLREPGSLLA